MCNYSVSRFNEISSLHVLQRVWLREIFKYVVAQIHSDSSWKKRNTLRMFRARARVCLYDVTYFHVSSSIPLNRTRSPSLEIARACLRTDCFKIPRLGGTWALTAFQNLFITSRDARISPVPWCKFVV